MREIRQSGSVRGVRRNPYPYRDPLMVQSADAKTASKTHERLRCKDPKRAGRGCRRRRSVALRTIMDKAARLWGWGANCRKDIFTLREKGNVRFGDHPLRTARLVDGNGGLS
jgi:hypothetical protein